jgi:putative flippase GtrA
MIAKPRQARIMLANLWRWRLARFLFVGAFNTIFGYGVFFALLRADLAPTLALAAATVVGVAVNFFTTGRIVFANSDATLLWRFVLVYAFVFIVNAILLKAALRAGFEPALAQALLLGPCVALSFFLNRTYVFALSQEAVERQ